MLIVSTFPPSNDAIADYTESLADELSKEEYRVSIVVPKNMQKRRLVAKSHLTIQEAGSSPGLAFTIIREALQTSPAIIHVQHELFLYGSWLSNLSIMFALLSLKLLRKRVIVTLHHVLIPEQIQDAQAVFNVRLPYFAIRCGLLMFYSVARRTDATIVASPEFKKSLVDYYGFQPNRVHVVPHAADFDKGEPIKLSERAEDSSPTILFYGFLRPGKGVEVLVKALGLLSIRIPKLRLIILYKIQEKYSAYLESLEKLIADLHLEERVFLVNAGHKEGMNHILAADIAVFPFTSIVGTTSWSYVRIAQYRKPMIVSRVLADASGLREQDEVLIVEPGNHEGLAAAIEKLVNDKDRGAKMAMSLYQRLEAYDWSMNANSHIEIYSGLQHD